MISLSVNGWGIPEAVIARLVKRRMEMNMSLGHGRGFVNSLAAPGLVGLIRDFGIVGRPQDLRLHDSFIF